MTVVVDASAVLSVLRGEEDQEVFKTALHTMTDLHMSLINAWEVMARYVPARGPAARHEVDAYFQAIGLTFHEATADQYEGALDAQLRFGWSTPAKLNTGDCFAYALARSLDAAILFKGKDFALTDLKSAL